MGTSNLIYISQLPTISVSLILQPNNHTTHLLWCSSLCNFLEFPSISSKLQSNITFSNHYIRDTLTVKDAVSHKSASNVELEIFPHTQLNTGWFVNSGHYYRIRVIFSIFWVPVFFNSCEHYTVKVSQLHGIFEKLVLEDVTVKKKRSFFYEIKYKNQMFQVMCLFNILTHNIFNNTYLSFWVGSGYHLVTVQIRTSLYGSLTTET
jgi:hypothetical protein